MSMAPSVESSSFSQYSSNPTPPVSGQSGVGTGGWFKEHALIILLGVIALVAVLWFIARRSNTGSASLSPDNGYPLGYPSVGAGTSGGSGASSGSSGTGDTGTGATNSDQAIKDFMEGFALRDGQIQPQGTSTSTTNTTNTTNYYTTPDPIAPNIIINNPAPAPQPITTPPPPITTTVRTQTQSLQSAPAGTTSQALNAARAGVTAQAIQTATQSALNSVFSSPSTGTHVATTSTHTSSSSSTTGKTTQKKKSSNQKGTAAAREE